MHANFVTEDFELVFVRVVLQVIPDVSLNKKSLSKKDFKKFIQNENYLEDFYTKKCVQCKIFHMKTI